MRERKLKAKVIAIASAIVAAAPKLAIACATCGLGEDGPAIHAYKASTLFMVASPYISFVVIGGAAYLAYRRSNRRNPAPPGNTKR